MNFDFVTDLFLWLAELATSADPWQQIGVLMLAGAIPFIESYLGSFLGVILGLNPYLVVGSAVVGNMVSTFLLIAAAGGARSAVTRKNRTAHDAATGTSTATLQEQRTPRQQKVAKYANRLGVPGVCLLGPLLLASQITAPTLVALGAAKRSVYIWQAIAIIVWGVLFGFFGDAVVRFFL